MKHQAMTQEQKVTYMTTRPVKGLVCEMAVPTIISMLVTSFYNMADTFFVGKINTQSTAAVGVVFSVMALIQALGFFFGHGSGNYISRRLGARDYESANIMAANGFFCAFICGIAVEILGLVFLKPIAVLLGSTPTILPYTQAYLKIILLGAPFMTSFDMGISGAALATVISQICSFGLLVIGSTKGGNIRVRFRNFHPTLYYLKEMFRGGFPSLCRQGLGSIAGIFLNHSAGIYAGIYGDAAIAGMSIVTRVTMFANSALIGFGQGFQPVCGMNYGAGKFSRVREAFWFCVKYATVFLIFISLTGGIFAENIVTIFRREDADVIRIGTLALRLQCLVFPFSAWIVMCNMMLQSIGKALKASIVAAARQGLFFIPLIWILPYFFGLLGVQMCQTVSDVFSLLLSIPLGLSVLKEMKTEDTPENSVSV